MFWEAFLGGLIAGWLIEFAVDYFFWRPRRICSEAEEELQEAAVILKREVSRLRQQQKDAAEEREEDEEEEQQDDLERIWGIGPKVEALLFLKGITSFSQLATTSTETLEQILQSGGEHYRLTRYNVLESWQQQAVLAAGGRWTELDALQAELGGRRKTSVEIKGR